MSKVKFNISNMHVALKTVGLEGAISYETPFALPGAVALTLEPKGETSSFYADGIEYYKSAVNGGYEGDIESALVSDEFREKILKEIKDSKNVLLETTDAEAVEFAFGFQIDGDTKNTRFWFYNCTASRPTTASKTVEENKEPQTDSLKISATSEKVIAGNDTRIVRSKTTDATNSDSYDNWFKQVYIPVLSPEAP